MEYDEIGLIWMISWALIGNAVINFISLQFLKAPYGRYSSVGYSKYFGFSMNAKLAWILQEAPAFMIPLTIIVQHDQMKKFLDMKDASNILMCYFLIHYFQRSFIYPFLIRGGKPTPIGICLFAFVFCSLNGYIQGKYLHLTNYPENYIYTPKFIIGSVLFFLGMLINLHSDHILRNLRKPGDTGYKIPHGGLFEYVSGANFFAELVEWTGFALACWNLPSLSFLIYTACNVGPRAMSHHRWYLEKFEDYPKKRKGFIPFIM